MTGKYQAEIDLDNKNSSHTLIVELIGRDKQVLDVGTATGYLAETLKKRGCEITGIEIDPDAARLAERHCQKVIVGDVETLDLREELETEYFDVIVLGDVLEHLKEPLRSLKRLKAFLKSGGYVVASIPNVAHGSVRLALMQGEFRYGSLGLLDATHLRFFTRESVERLFNDAGLLIGELQRTRLGIFDTEVKVDRESIPKETLNWVRNAPEALTYQFVLMAYPFGEASMIARLSDRADLLSEKLALTTNQLRQREMVIQDLNRKLRNFDRLQQMLENCRAELAEKSREVTELAEKLAARNRQLANIKRERREVR
jgi:O-antigen biosynthesis protein